MSKNQIKQYNHFISQACSSCGSFEWEYISFPLPKINQINLDFWGQHEKVYFGDGQSEMHHLADMKHLPLLLKAIDERSYLKIKQMVLVEALCILFYDNLLDLEEYDQDWAEDAQNNVTLLTRELSQRFDFIMNHSDFVEQYIKAKILPLL